jgi:hypothetical protein
VVRAELLVGALQRGAGKDAPAVDVEGLEDPFVHKHHAHHAVDERVLRLDAEVAFEPLIPFHHNTAVHRGAQINGHAVGLLMGQRSDQPLPVFHDVYLLERLLLTRNANRNSHPRA